MPEARLTRREFLLVAGALAAGTLAPGPTGARAAPQGLPTARVIYRLSLRGRRGSTAARLHNANLLFASVSAADGHRAHPGDRSRIVSVVVNADEFDRLFSSRRSDTADLRALGGPVLVGDCNRNGTVAIDELVRGVNILLGDTPVSACTPFDRVADGRVTVDELVRGVANALA